MELQEQVAVVTGAARGIGLAIAHSLAEAGARVAIVDLDGEEAQRATRGLPTRGLALQADVSRESEMQLVIGEVLEVLGGVDILVNNAGGGRPGSGMGSPFTRVSEADWDEHLALNLRTAFAASKAAIPALLARGGGSIVNIASVAGQLPNPTTPAYGAAKAGMISLTRSLAFELAPRNVRVNAVCPGLVWTRAWEHLAEMIKAASPQLAELSPRQIFDERVRRHVPLRREQTAEDVGALTRFLCSAAARNITGQVIAVDGGLTLGG